MFEMVTKSAWLLLVVVSFSLFVSRSLAADPISQPLRVLILDGHNQHHNWQATTPLLQHILRSSGRFHVDVATAPPEGEDMSHYRPDFGDYDVVLSNYNSQYWDDEIKESFLEFVRGGGGFVCVHAANNAFADWQEYNEICGLGGWGGRDERWGPYVYFQDDELIRDDTPGRAGHHGPQHEFQITMRDLEHPITQGLPTEWMHSKDELYDRLRGPAKNMHILASAFSDPDQKGTGRHEPMMMVIDYGEGRVFHTVLGHADYSMQCVGFITTLLRGTEWAATGEVTIPVPDDFPTAELTRSRE
jgi:type 1 glutamine amidotransferase